jgi:hypothetical protein
MLATRESARGAFSSKMKNMVVRARLCAQLGISDARSASLTFILFIFYRLPGYWFPIAYNSLYFKKGEKLEAHEDSHMKIIDKIK